MRSAGYTMLEVMFVVAIFSIVTGILFTVSLSLGTAIETQNIKAVSNDEMRRVLLELVPELRQARRTSIDFNALPGTSITYRIPEDLDGNGTAVSQGLQIELGLPITVELDLDDRNQDGFTVTQLVRVQDGEVTVLANNLATRGAFDTQEEPIRGVWFEPFGAGVRMTLTTEGRDRQQRAYRNSFEQIIMPRN